MAPDGKVNREIADSNGFSSSPFTTGEDFYIIQKLRMNYQRPAPRKDENAMLQFDEYRVKLNNLKPELDGLGRALDLEAAERELDELHAQIGRAHV